MNNLRIILTAGIALLALTLTTPAMAGGAGGIGLKGGLAISTLGNDSEDFSDARARFRLGGTGGLSYEFATPGTFAFDMEFLYDLRGAKNEFESGGAEVIAKDYLHYVNFPMALKFYIGDVFNIHFGGYVGVAVAGKRKIEGTLGLGPIEYNDGDEINLFGEDIQDAQGDDYMKRLDGGLLAGIEFVSTKGMGVGSRAYLGLADITNDDHVLGTERAMTAEISIYAIFRLGN